MTQLIIPKRPRLAVSPKLTIPRRFFIGGASALLSRKALAAASTTLNFSVAGTAFPGQAGNTVGYPGYSGFSGSGFGNLTSGGSSSAGGATLKWFDGGQNPVNISGSGPLTFTGCYFGSNTGNTPGCTSWSGSGGITFNYCTFGPPPSQFGSFPPQPPSGGGYTTWPSLNGNGLNCSSGLAFSSEYGAGPCNPNGPWRGGQLTYTNCDVWGGAAGILFSGCNISNQIYISNCWIHDFRSGCGDHDDGVGADNGGPVMQYYTVTGCTISTFGNTFGISNQFSSSTTMTNVTITNNYLTGFDEPLNLINVNGFLPVPYTDIVFTGNTFGPLPQAKNALTYGTYSAPFNITGSGNKWRLNKILPGTYPQVGTVTSANPYLWPNGTANATDWAGAF